MGAVVMKKRNRLLTPILDRQRVDLLRALPLALLPRRLILGVEMGLIGHHLAEKSNREKV